MVHSIQSGTNSNATIGGGEEQWWTTHTPKNIWSAAATVWHNNGIVSPCKAACKEKGTYNGIVLDHVIVGEDVALQH